MATNTAASFTNHTGNGTAGPFNISFSYLSEAEVDVTVGGVLKTITTHYTFTSATQITFTSGNEPANGVAIKFQRDTNISAKKVDFADGSVLTEADLDANSDQVLFAQQEIIDKLGTIEENATGDQTNAEIRAAVEAASDSNVFTDADHSKLNAIEASATADQTAAEIRTLVESASDSNVFTDADHTKLNGIEASATADQTAAEIRTLVESASDSNVFTDADHTKLNGIETGATADQTVSEIKSLIAGSPLDATHLAANSVDSSELVDGSVDTSHLSADCVDGTKIADNAIGSEHLQANSVTTSEIADAELTTLAGMQSGTASKLADSTALTSDIADLNQLDGMAKQTTITDDDTKFPTSGAVVDFVAAQIAPIGGLEVIANEDSFPSTQPSSGVVISISDIEGLIVNGSGVATNARTTGNGSDNVTINGFPSSLQSKTMAAGLGLMVSSTGSSQTYTYHKLLAKEADVEQLSNDINDFAARYRVVSSNPTSDNDAGDLIFNTSTQKLLVFNSTSNAFEEAQSIGNFFISTFSESFDGSRTDFTVSNAPANAQQIILSINGVVQKPNSGTSTPSEGFALSGSTVKLSSAPASGSDVFIVVMGSTVNIGTPSNNTVTSAILQNGSVIEAKLADSAITNAKVNASAAIDGSKINPTFTSNVTISNTQPEIFLQDTNNNSDFKIQNVNGIFKILDATGNNGRFNITSDGTATFTQNLNANSGLDVTGAITGTGDLTIDTNTLHVDSSNNRVGIGTTSPDAPLTIHNSSDPELRFGYSSSQDHRLSWDSSKVFLHADPDNANNSSALGLAVDGTTRLYILDSGNVGIGTTSPNAKVTICETGTLTGGDININADGLVIDNNGGNTGITFKTPNSASSRIAFGDPEDNNAGQILYSQASNYFAFDTSGSERMRINSNGDIMAGRTSVFSGARLSLEKSGTCLGIRQAGNADHNSIEMTHVFATSGSTNAFQLSFRDASGNQRGSITNTTSTTSYNTSSDYRLKENEVLISDGITRLKTLKPYKFNWKAEPSTIVDGFFAHEVSDAVPEAVVGEKDASIGEDGKGYQQIDHSKLVPLLTAALQEAIAKIETLETKVAALGG